MKISLIGLPGSGKSTLAQLLSNILDVMYISSGSLARAHGFAGSEEEKAGKLDPNENKIRALVKEAIGDSTKYILDGFPRTLDQIEKVGIPFDVVLYLNMAAHVEVAIQRLIKRGRPDDNIDTILRRMQTYYENTAPLADYFDDKGILINIDATGTISNTIRQAIVKLANKNILEASEYVQNLMKNIKND